MRRKSRPSPLEEAVEEPLINLTPLIDVVFVVLITFMLLAPLLEIESIDLASAGDKGEASLAQNRILSLSIRSDGSFWFRNRSMGLKELEPLLREEKKTHPEQTPQIAPDRNAPFGAYQELKNLLEACGFEHMELLLSPK